MATAGTEHLFTMSMISSSAMPEMAITTPATGDIQRPMPEDSCIGRAMVAVETPIWAVTSGTSGPKAYHGNDGSALNSCQGIGYDCNTAQQFDGLRKNRRADQDTYDICK